MEWLAVALRCSLRFGSLLVDRTTRGAPRRLAAARSSRTARRRATRPPPCTVRTTCLRIARAAARPKPNFPFVRQSSQRSWRAPPKPRSCAVPTGRQACKAAATRVWRPSLASSRAPTAARGTERRIMQSRSPAALLLVLSSVFACSAAAPGQAADPRVTMTPTQTTESTTPWPALAKRSVGVGMG